MRVAGKASGDLMIVQGPLALDWRNRKFGLLPRIESSDIRRSCPPTPDRVDSWVRTAVHVEGKPDWVFVKIHTHGAPERNAAMLLGNPMRDFHDWLGRTYNDGQRWSLHYVTAREMYNVAMAAIDGKSGDPGHYRDHVLPPPPAARV